MIHTHRKIHSHLQKATNILIVPHQNPDGDALGCASAMVEYLKKMNKKFFIFCATAVPDQLEFLPHMHLVDIETKILTDHKIDTIIVLDSGDLRYAGIAKFIKEHPATLINIDHHPTNENYGHINLVNSQASSVAEILYDFFKHNNIRLTRNLATALLTGLITDTGNFTNSATSASSITIAGHLLRCGANLSLVNKWVNKNTSINSLKLWGVVLKRLEKNEQMDLVYTYLTKKDYDKYGINDRETEGISNFMNTIDDAKICLFIKETDEGKIKGSFRTTHDDVDVSAMAKKLGGGGHKKAAGFTLDGTVKEVLKKVLTLGA